MPLTDAVCFLHWTLPSESWVGAWVGGRGGASGPPPRQAAFAVPASYRSRDSRGLYTATWTWKEGGSYHVIADTRRYQIEKHTIRIAQCKKPHMVKFKFKFHFLLTPKKGQRGQLTTHNLSCDRSQYTNDPPLTAHPTQTSLTINTRG